MDSEKRKEVRGAVRGEEGSGAERIGQGPARRRCSGAVHPMAPGPALKSCSLQRVVEIWRAEHAKMLHLVEKSHPAYRRLVGEHAAEAGPEGGAGRHLRLEWAGVEASTEPGGRALPGPEAEQHRWNQLATNNACVTRAAGCARADSCALLHTKASYE